MEQTQIKVDYTDLQEWLSHYKLTWTDLALQAGVSGQAVSRYKAADRPFPSTWILIWQKAYRWSVEQMARFCLRVRR